MHAEDAYQTRKLYQAAIHNPLGTRVIELSDLEAAALEISPHTDPRGSSHDNR